MSEDHSDPDLLDLDDVPDTATGMRPIEVAGLIKGVHGLGRWAKRIHKERKDAAQAAEDSRRLLRGVILAVVGGSGAVIVAIAGAIWSVSADRAEARASMEAMRDDVAELREAYERVEARQWDGGPAHTSARREESE